MSAVIIDYGMGNVASVQKALDHLRISSIISNQPSDISRAQYLILPGVGSFSQGMDNLRQNGLADLLSHEVLLNKKPFLGICLGMQLIATEGTEPQTCKGLGWIPGEVIKIEEPDKRIPHLGWNQIHAKKNGLCSPFDERDFYFIHSYHFKPESPSHIAATVSYGSEYVAALEHENIFATQFHPEKSQQAGLDLLAAFFKRYA